MKKPLAGITLLAALQIAAPERLPAQQILLNDSEAAPVEPEVAPPSAPSGLPVMQWRTPTADEATPAEAEPIRLPLRPLTPQAGGAGTHRIQGQFADARFLMFLPEGVDGAELDLTTISSINVLPERSQIDVTVNGLAVGSITPDNFDGARSDALSVPPGVLKAGRNVITLKARHVHRVFCSPEASFGVWTDVLLSDSGVTVMPDMLQADPLGFLAAVSAQIGQSEPIIVNNAGTESHLAQGAAFIAHIEHLFEGLPPQIAVEDLYTVAYDRPQLARVTAFPDDFGAGDLPQFRRGGDGAIVLLANAEHPDAVEKLLIDAVGESGLDWTAPDLAPGTAQSLSDLGFERLVGRGRYIRETVPFRLPPQWLLLSEERAELRLDYAFARNLPEGALLLVKINGETVRLLPLDDPEQAGRRVDTLQVPFPVNMLGPGTNRLTFEALVPGDPPDEACVPREDPIFEVFETTQLSVPEAPRMSVPRIDRVLDGLSPDQIRFSAAGQATLPLGLLPQVASVFVNEDTSMATGQGPVTLTIGVPADLSTLEGNIVDGNATVLQEAMLNTPSTRAADIDTWAEIDNGRWWAAFADRDRAIETLGRFKQQLVSLWRGPQSELNTWMAGRSAEAMILQPDMKRPDDLWLIVRPNAPDDRVVASLISMRQSLEGPGGQLSLFSADTGWQSWRASTLPLRLHEPITWRNARSVAGNYASLTPGGFLVPIFFFTLIAAVVALGYMIASRRGKK
ncbi:cellulose biosynthesis cyclic di-GMP-binding regulatory protein BcsB [Pseudooceanicola nanhaiensis]|uniref:cellulose biosynthesis cyclic di-GMP-binding regulatory protein BcsB n=1 Tax=Pseudooceanicola nanhaiensis TaxID=375761 RepID=UPI001CD51316|nr:cellulose biosynthesis cyclic di-GMP-binding regulatory protein BcsB [Pseudooceanicola nanhaiensis]MCA0922218.1 cellulose biosynthesis cyclic di-GMP-binding regulatory protein BcsB [Pseudooceanicola nanhaiensis]